jgi:hypothetical protein
MLPFKITDILVTFGAIVIPLIFVQTKVKFSPMLYDRFVKRRKKHMILSVHFWQGHHQQSVVLAYVTPGD